MPLYVITESSTGPCKIGRGDPTARLLSLQTGNPRPLRLVAAIVLAVPQYEKNVEIEVHRHLVALRLCGEWFDLAPDTALAWVLKRCDAMCVEVAHVHDMRPRHGTFPNQRSNSALTHSPKAL